MKIFLQCLIFVNSMMFRDAHVDVDAGNFTYVKEVLKFCDFPEELVVTTKFDVLKQYLNMNTFGM